MDTNQHLDKFTNSGCDHDELDDHRKEQHLEETPAQCHPWLMEGLSMEEDKVNSQLCMHR